MDDTFDDDWETGLDVGGAATICSGNISTNAALFLASDTFLVSSARARSSSSNFLVFAASILSRRFRSFIVTSFSSSHLTDAVLEDEETPDMPEDVDIGLSDDVAESVDADLPLPTRRSSPLADDAESLLDEDTVLIVPNLNVEGNPIPNILAFLLLASSIFGC